MSWSLTVNKVNLVTRYCHWMIQGSSHHFLSEAIEEAIAMVKSKPKAWKMIAEMPCGEVVSYKRDDWIKRLADGDNIICPCGRIEHYILYFSILGE